jgi:superfamily II DNA/RNA helicase
VKLLEQHAESKIRQRFYEVKHEERLQAVATLLKHYRPVSTLAFCNTKQQCRDLLNVLRHEGIQALTLNGDLEQRERDQVLIQFANRSCSVLVATDVAARGLDIAQLEAVINVDVTPDPEIHIHRIGRTGRGDEDGWALSLCSPADKRRLATIAEMMKATLETARTQRTAGSRRLAAGAADGDAADARRAQGQDPPRRRARRPDRRSGLHPRAGRQDHGDRSNHVTLPSPAIFIVMPCANCPPARSRAKRSKSGRFEASMRRSGNPVFQLFSGLTAATVATDQRARPVTSRWLR